MWALGIPENPIAHTYLMDKHGDRRFLCFLEITGLGFLSFLFMM